MFVCVLCTPPIPLAGAYVSEHLAPCRLVFSTPPRHSLLESLSERVAHATGEMLATLNEHVCRSGAASLQAVTTSCSAAQQEDALATNGDTEVQQLVSRMQVCACDVCNTGGLGDGHRAAGRWMTAMLENYCSHHNPNPASDGVAAMLKNCCSHHTPVHACVWQHGLAIRDLQSTEILFLYETKCRELEASEAHFSSLLAAKRESLKQSDA